MRRFASVRFVVLLGLAAVAGTCGGSSGGGPGPTPVAPGPTTVTGLLTATNGGQPLPNVEVKIASLAATQTDATGTFSVAVTSPGDWRQIDVSSPALVPRSIIAAIAPGLRIDAISLAPQFSLDFYRQLVRDTTTAGTLRSLRRWTTNPRVYIRTVDDDGQPVSERNLVIVDRTIRETMPIWTAGRIGLAGVELGVESRIGVPGWITVQWGTSASANDDAVCARAQIAVSGGFIWINHRRASAGCRCDGGSDIKTETVRHELGHALGFYHTTGATDVMGTGAKPCDMLPSPREQYHAAIAYSRPFGNADPDTDPAPTAGAQRRQERGPVIAD